MNNENCKLNIFETTQEDPDRTLTVLSEKSVKISYDSQHNNGRWTKNEHVKFLKALVMYGNDWKKIQTSILTRSPTQIRSHAQKFFIRIKNKFMKDLNQEDIKLISDDLVNSWVQKFIEKDLINGVRINNSRNIKNVIISMLRHSGKIRKNSNDSEYIEDFMGRSNVDEFFKPYEVKQKIFKIEKIKKNIPWQPIIQNTVFNQPRNSYINIVTINVCKNNENMDCDDYSNEVLNNPLYINYLSDQKMKGKLKTKTDFDFIEKVDNTFNLNFEYRDELEDFGRSMDNEYNEFDLNKFFNSR
jgi:SHAQKYF class myb-like DNA-binding protein